MTSNLNESDRKIVTGLQNEPYGCIVTVYRSESFLPIVTIMANEPRSFIVTRDNE